MPYKRRSRQDSAATARGKHLLRLPSNRGRHREMSLDRRLDRRRNQATLRQPGINFSVYTNSQATLAHQKSRHPSFDTFHNCTFDSSTAYMHTSHIIHTHGPDPTITTVPINDQARRAIHRFWASVC